MKKLYLVRHAKSSWDHDGVHDMDRPLKGRGITDAYETSQHLVRQREVPQRMYSSPATRALHTALIFAREMNYPFNEIEIVPALYECRPDDLARHARSIPDSVDSAMIFGHNPAITTFVNQCIAHHIDNVPTTGVACLRFDIESWSALDDRAELVFFDYPKRRRIQP